MSGEHSPTPWDTDEPHIVYARDDDRIVYLADTSDLDTDYVTAKANAAFIVKAANNHEALMLELDMKEGDLVMLRQAVEAGDPKNELLIRINDMLRNTRELRVKASTP